MTADIANRNFSITEVCVLLALEMGDWHLDRAEQGFTEMGGDRELFARALARLIQDGILTARTGTRNTPSRVQVGNLFEALELKHRQVQNDRLLRALVGEEA